MIDQIEALHQEQLLSPFLCIALGANPFLHPNIDACYRKNEWEFYEAYQKSKLNGNPLFSMYTTKSEEKIRQVAGLVEWCYQTQQFSQLDQLIKKGYKFAYLYFQRQTRIDFEHFMRSFAKMLKSKGKMVKEVELIHQNIILWYLCVRENKPFNSTNVAWLSFQEVLSASINDTKLKDIIFSKESLEKYKDEISDLYEEYNIPKTLRFETLGNFIDYLISNSLKEVYRTYPYCDAEMAEKKVFQRSPAKYIGAIGGWLKSLKIHELDATEQVPFTKRDLDHVFLELFYAKKSRYISKEDQDLFFITCLYLKGMSSLYHETKEVYLDQSKRDHYIELKAKEAEICEKEAELLRKQQIWMVLQRKKQKEIDGLTEELRDAQAKIRQLEQHIEDMDDYKKEVYSLRNYIHREEQKLDHVDQVPSLQTITELIQSKRVVVFGGNRNWQLKLRDHLPTIEFFDVDEINRDISKIQQVDAVFVNTTVFAHSFYKKIMKELSENQTPLYYLSGQTNMKKTALEIYNWLID
ncbi:hypothetical protein [Niallia sp. Krafla_26]|uniref:hypothetical protein n=1 Tax=Niallia sp. Krafla_26 TaxID=3064703 RepID=UPI003D171884